MSSDENDSESGHSSAPPATHAQQGDGAPPSRGYVNVHYCSTHVGGTLHMRGTPEKDAVCSTRAFTIDDGSERRPCVFTQRPSAQKVQDPDAKGTVARPISRRLLGALLDRLLLNAIAAEDAERLSPEQADSTAVPTSSTAAPAIMAVRYLFDRREPRGLVVRVAAHLRMGLELNRKLGDLARVAQASRLEKTVSKGLAVWAFLASEAPATYGERLHPGESYDSIAEEPGVSLPPRGYFGVDRWYEAFGVPLAEELARAERDGDAVRVAVEERLFERIRLNVDAPLMQALAPPRRENDPWPPRLARNFPEPARHVEPMKGPTHEQAILLVLRKQIGMSRELLLDYFGSVDRAEAGQALDRLVVAGRVAFDGAFYRLPPVYVSGEK